MNSAKFRCTRGVSGEQRQCWLRDVEPRMPRKGRTRQYQSHTLKLRHWLLEVKIHHFPRRGAACRPRPSCCSPGTRLCPLWGQRDLGLRGCPPAQLPCHQPSPGRAAKAFTGKFCFPSQITWNDFNLSHVPREGRWAEAVELLHFLCTAREAELWHSPTLILFMLIGQIKLLGVFLF